MAMQGAQGQQGAQPQMGGGAGISFAKFESYLKRLGGDQLKALTADPKYNQNAVYFSMINNEIMARLKTQQEKQMQAQGQQQGAVPTVKENVQQAAQQLTDDAVVSAASGGIMRAAYRLPEDTGIAQLPAQNIANMAGGGIVAFASGGDMEDGGVYYDPSMDIRQADEDVIALGGEGAGGIEQIPQPQKILKDATTPIGRQIQQFFLGDIKPPSNEERLRELLFSKIRQEYEPRSGLRGKFSSQSESEYQRANDIMAQAEALRKRGDVEGLQTMVGELFNPDAARVTGAATTPGRVVPGFKPEEPASAAPKPAAPRAQAAPRGPAGALPGAAPAGLAATAPGQAALEAPKPPTFDFDYAKARETEEAELRKLQDARREKLTKDREELENYFTQRGEYGKGREERLAKQEEGLAKRREEAKGMALLEIAAGIFAAPPGRGAIAALGVGMQRGLKSYQGDMEKLQAAADRIQAARDALEDIRYREAGATDAERRRLRSEERQITVDGAKGYQELARRYGVEMPMKQASLNFEKALKVWEVQTREAGDTAREQMRQSNANLREGMGNAAALQAAGIRAAATGAGGLGRLDEAARLRLKAIDDFTDPSKRILIKQQFPNVKTFDDYLTALGLPLKDGTGASTSAFPGASIVGSRKD